MKYNNLTIGFGIVFGLGMLPLAYLNLILGIALAFLGFGDFAFMIYVFAVLGVLSIIASCFARKCVWVPRIILTLTALTLLGTIIYLVACGLLFNNLLLAAAYLFVMTLGPISVIFAWKAKKKNKVEAKTEIVA